jgi:hypothetical protein
MRCHPAILGISTALVLVAVSKPGAAQLNGGVDAVLGGAPTLQNGGMESHWALATGAHYVSSRLRLDAEGEYREGGLGTEASASLGASHFTRLGGGLLFELTGAARGRAGNIGLDGVIWDLGGRVHLDGTRRGAWLGLSAGEDLRGATSRWEAAAWHRFGRVSVQLTGSQTAAVDLVRLTTPGPDTLVPTIDTTTAPRVRISTDLGAWLRWAHPRVDLALGLGRRYGVPQVALSPSALTDPTVEELPRGGTGTTVSDWWLAEGTYWLTRQFGVSASIGHSPPDRQFGTPGGRFVRFAISAAFGRQPTRAAGHAVGTTGVRLHRIPGGSVLFELLVGGGSTVRRVEVMGDFTDWRPVDMQLMGPGRWQLRLPILPGLHHLNVRYDGGPWQPPPGTGVVADEFDQLTGVLVVE